ncbi:hypothetical protein [Streptomyces sp. NPDC004270]
MAPAAGSSQARSVTSAPIAAPRSSGSRPLCRTADAVRGFGFTARPLPPFLRAASSAARSATRPGRQVRRLRICWEIRDDIHHAFVTLGCAVICRRRLRTALCRE